MPVILPRDTLKKYDLSEQENQPQSDIYKYPDKGKKQ
jgi:hypothetical protein